MDIGSLALLLRYCEVPGGSRAAVLTGDKVLFSGERFSSVHPSNCPPLWLALKPLQLRLRADWRSLWAGWRGLRDSWRSLQAWLTGLMASLSDLRTSQQGRRASQRRMFEHTILEKKSLAMFMLVEQAKN